MKNGIEVFSRECGLDGAVPGSLVLELFRRGDLSDACRSVAAWLNSEDRNVFLQDADPLVMKTPDLIQVLTTVTETLGPVGRITAYSRATTTHRLGKDRLILLKNAGLSRVHTGLESGSGEVLTLTEKGTPPDVQISGGKAVREAGLELSLYIMPGLGGRKHSHDHARETARIISAVEPDFVRLRTLAVIPGTPLFEHWTQGVFETLPEMEILTEIKMFLEHLNVSRGYLASDHILNLLGDLEGNLPDNIPEFLKKIDAVLDFPKEDQILYQLGKRMGTFRTPDDLNEPDRRSKAELFLTHLREENVDPEAAVQDIMMRFV